MHFPAEPEIVLMRPPSLHTRRRRRRRRRREVYSRLTQ